MALSPSDIERTNPAGWPEAALGRFQRAITVEYTSLTRAGLPIMIPLTPFLGEDQLSVDVSTGLTYPAKAERARRNPKVCLLFSDPVGSGLSNPPIVLVQGLARLASSRPHGSSVPFSARKTTTCLPWSGLWRASAWLETFRSGAEVLLAALDAVAASDETERGG